MIKLLYQKFICPLGINEQRIETTSKYVQLPLKDMFCNREIEFDFNLEQIKIREENMRYPEAVLKQSSYLLGL